MLSYVKKTRRQTFKTTRKRSYLLQVNMSCDVLQKYYINTISFFFRYICKNKLMAFYHRVAAVIYSSMILYGC